MDPLAQVVAAINAQRSPNPDEINAANAFLGSWYESPECPSMALDIVRGQLPVNVVCTAAIALCRKIKEGWGMFNAELRDRVLEFAHACLEMPNLDKSVLRCFSYIVAAVGFYEWPAYWVDFLEVLIARCAGEFDRFVSGVSFLEAFATELDDGVDLLISRKQFLRGLFVLLSEHVLKIVLKGLESDITAESVLRLLCCVIKWSSATDFFNTGLVELLLGQLERRAGASDCLKALFMDRFDTLMLFRVSAATFFGYFYTNPTVGAKRVDLLLSVLHVYGRRAEQMCSEPDGLNVEHVRRAYSILLESEIGDDLIDEFFDMWGRMGRRMFIENRLSFAGGTLPIIMPLVQNIRSRVLELLPIAQNADVAGQCFDIFAKIDIDSFCVFLAAQRPSETLTYALGCIQYGGFIEKHEGFIGYLRSYAVALLAETDKIDVARSAVDALPRMVRVLSGPGYSTKMCDLFMRCLAQEDLLDDVLDGLYEAFRRNSTRFTCEVPGFVPTVVSKIMSDFGSYDEAIAVKAIKVVVMMIESEATDETAPGLFGTVSSAVLSFMDYAAPTAMQMISEVARYANRFIVVAVREYWSHVFGALTKDPLLTDDSFGALLEMINASLAVGYSEHVDAFVATFDRLPDELVFTAITSLRRRSLEFEALYRIVEDRLVTCSAMCPQMFECILEFETRLMNGDAVVPVICRGIVDVHPDVSRAAARCSFELAKNSPERGAFLLRYHQVLVLALFRAMLDGLHKSSHDWHISVLASLLTSIVQFDESGSKVDEAVAQALVQCGINAEQAQPMAVHIKNSLASRGTFFRVISDLLLALKAMTMRDHSRVTAFEQQIDQLVSALPDPNGLIPTDIPTDLMHGLSVDM